MSQVEAVLRPCVRCEVAIVDDDEAARLSTACLLGAGGFRTLPFASGEAFLAAGLSPTLSCILLDLEMQGRSGLDVLRELSRQKGSPPVIVLTGHADIDMAVEAMKLGAIEFIQKPYAPDRLLRALASVTAPPDQSPTTRPVDREADALLERLTDRQRQVLAGIVRGHPNKIIAWELQLSTRTVESYRAGLFTRLGVRNAAEAIRIALAAGMGSDRYS